MANPINQGNQILTWDYLNEASSLSFNKLLKDLVEPGIYRGGLLSYAGGSITVGTYSLLVETTNPEFARSLAVRVETQDSTILPYNAATPYVVGELDWVEVEDNYLLLKCVDEAYVNANPKAVVFGMIPPSFVPDYSRRSIVTHKADTLKLGDTIGINSNPTGGTSSVFSGSAYTASILVDIYARLIDLSGVQDGAVKKRHVSFGVGANDVTGGDIQIATTIDMGGSAPDLPPNTTIAAAIAALATALKNMTGADAASVKPSHLDAGTGGSQISGKTFPVGTNIDQNVALASPIDINDVDKLDIALTKLAAAVGAVASLHSATKSTVDSLVTAVINITNDINNTVKTMNFMPIGSIIMYDGNSWEDNVTLKGWYACIAANAGRGCPNLVDEFIKGADPSGYPLPVNMAQRFVGTMQITLTAAQLPKHVHVMTHGHNLTIHEDGKHSHTYTRYNSKNNSGISKDDCWSDNGTVNTSEAGLHSHPGSVCDNYVGSTLDGGFANDPITLNPRAYRLIFVRRCA